MKQGGHINKLLDEARKKLQEKHESALKKAQEAYDAALAAFEEVESEEGSAKHLRAKNAVADAQADLAAVKKNDTPELRELAAEQDRLVEEGKEANAQYAAFRKALKPLAKKAGEKEDEFFEKVNKRFIAGELDIDDVPDEVSEIAGWVESNLADAGDGDGDGGKKKPDGKPAGKKTAEELASEKTKEGDGGAARGGGDKVKEEDKKLLDEMAEKTRLGIGPSYTEKELGVFIAAARGDFGGEPLTTDTLGAPVISDELPPNQVAGFAPLPAEQQAALRQAEIEMGMAREQAEIKAQGGGGKK